MTLVRFPKGEFSKEAFDEIVRLTQKLEEARRLAEYYRSCYAKECSLLSRYVPPPLPWEGEK